MLLSTNTFITWNSRNKKHYVERGYGFTKMGDRVCVKVSDLTKGSQAIVKLRCDYCGKDYNIQWYTYNSIHKKSNIQHDACADCGELKALDAINKKYGSFSNMYKISDEKRTNTNIQRYGSKNVFGSKIIQDKIVETNMKIYGVTHAQKSKTVREKTIQTCLERYGVANYIELYKGKFIGENSPVWKGGSKYSRVERATHEYQVWRKSVFQRDHYICQICGARSGCGNTVELHAHHLSNWADNPDKRYDIQNGVTLCDMCHYKFHSQYGKKNNTPRQFQQFIDNVELDEKIC